MAGSALAAVAAAVLASRLGVYGTIIGAGVVSVVATSGGSIFQYLFSRTGDQLREATVQARPLGGRRRVTPDAPGDDRTRPLARAEYGAVAGPAPGDTAPPLGIGGDGGDEFGGATTHGTRMRGWKRPLLGAAVVFGVSMVGITGFELASGSELGGGKGTTVGSVVRGDTGDSKPAPPPPPSDQRDQTEHSDPEESRQQSPPPATGDGETGRDQNNGGGDPTTGPDPTPSGSGEPSTGPSGNESGEPSDGQNGDQDTDRPNGPASTPSRPGAATGNDGGAGTGTENGASTGP
ncbi:hypothetical protein [Streptomyces sp. NPDC020965]|uniref:hypothetical protein n=1 Tax=Streptomyces sp. NPDC020965 TaxID=3365105 RepID=UPI0037996A10